MFWKKTYSLIVLLVYISSVFAQSSKADSILRLEKKYLQIVGALRNLSFEELENALQQEPNEKNKVKILNALCWKDFNPDPKKALTYAKQQMELAEKINYADAIEMSYDNLGNLYNDFGEFEKSISYLLKSLKMKEEKNDTTGMNWCLTGIGKTYYQMENFSEALKYFTKNSIIDSISENKENLATDFANIGACYLNLTQYEKALQFCLSAEILLKELHKKDETNLSNIGIIYLRKGMLDKAEQTLIQVLNIATPNNDVDLLANINTNLGLLYLKQNDYEKALRFELEAYRISKENNLKSTGFEISQSLANIYSAMGNFQKAFEYQKNYSSERDSFLTEANSRAITEMNTKYETEKKEQENKILRTEGDKQKAINEKQKAITIGVSIGLFLTLILAFYIFRGYKQKLRANRILGEKNILIEQQKKVVEQKNKDITDSINYAKRIQEAIIPTEKAFKTIFPDSFVLFRPKDIVSGDFYWIQQQNEHILFSAVDCTGHGVPGAFMSIVGNNLLNQSVKEHGNTQPSLILDDINEGLSASLTQSKEATSVKDGMDIALCSFNKKTFEMQFAGAFNPMLYIRENQLTEIKADRFPIGIVVGIETLHFTNNMTPLQKGDSVYIFSDGYCDQFGGPEGKKFKQARLKKLLLEINNLSMAQQKQRLVEEFELWKGNLEQIDDVLLIGVRI